MNNEIQSIYNLPVGSQCEHNGLVLTLTEDGWRAEVKHTMMRRCRDWDYCKPWTYLVTIGCQHHDATPRPLDISATWSYPQWLSDVYARSGRPHLFGEVVGGTAEEATVALTPLGKAVEASIMSIPSHYPQVRIIEKVVMPNHIHFVIRIKERLPEKRPLGFIINKFKSCVNRSYKALCLGLPPDTPMDLSYQQPAAPPAQSLAVPPAPAAPAAQSPAAPAAQSSAVPSSPSPAVPSSAFPAVPSSAPMAQSTKRHGTHPKIGLVFEPGFHDRILFREGQLQRMIDYCRDNPRRLWKVRNNSQFFRTVSGIRLVMPLLSESGTKGRSRWNGPVEGLIAPITYTASEMPTPPPVSNPAPSQIVTFTAIGNLALLKAPERMQIQCSRSMSDAELESLKQDVLEACRHGVVRISPCISPGERMIARAVMDEGFSLIALFTQGIPEDTTYKTYKEYFDACAEGQLLLMSPWRFENGKTHLARWQCLFLNDIAMQLMVGMNMQAEQSTL